MDPRRRDLVALIAVGAVSAALATLRFDPSLGGDRGVFLSAAATIVNGDHIYTDYFDHKDPAFYYLWALVSALGGSLGPFVLDGALLVVSGLIAFRISRLSKATIWQSLVAGVGTTALLSHPDVYFTGMSQLPGIVALLCAIHATLQRKHVALGVWLGLVATLKLPLLLLGAPIVTLVAVRSGSRAVGKTATGFATVVGLTIAILAFRGELSGYLDALALNVGYSDVLLEIRGQPPAPIGSAASAIDTIRGATFGAQVLVLHGAWLLVAAIIGLQRRRGTNDATILFIGVGAALATFTLSTTLFAHHLQATALLVAVAVPAVAQVGKHTAWTRNAAVAVIALVAVDGVASTVSDASAPEPIARPELTSFVEEATAPITANVTSYALAGENTDQGIVHYLDSSYELVCPSAYQLPWFGSERLETHLACLAEAPMIVVQPNVFTTNRAYVDENVAYRDYRRRLESLLISEFTVLAESEINGFLARVWVRGDVPTREIGS